MANRIFFALMALSAGLALVRGFALAAVLPVAEFGRYATVFAIGTFSASLFSFGLIERSLKRFPRLVADGHGLWALDEADRMVKKLAVRAAMAALPAIGIMSLLWADWVIAIVLWAAVAFATAAQSAYISLQRANGDLTGIGIASLSRALLSLSLAVAAAFLFGWQAALIGEVAGGLLGAVICRQFTVTGLSTFGEERPDNAKLAVDPEERELWTFLGFLGASIPLYLDRSAVALLLGADAAGTYAVLAILIMGSYTFTSIASQKLGPELVRMERTGAERGQKLRLLFVWSGAIALTGAFGLLVAGWAIIQGPLSFFGDRYPIGWEIILPAAILASFQITHLSEWYLLAHNRESSVFICTIILLCALATAFMLAGRWNAQLDGIFWLMAAAKFAQLAAIVFAVLVAGNRRPGAPA